MNHRYDTRVLETGLVTSSALLLGLWLNREQPGFPLAFVGILLNAGAIVVNGGYMPVWEPSRIVRG